MSELVVRNRQRVRRVNTPLLRRIVRSLLVEDVRLEAHELCIHLVGLVEMARVNRRYLDHAGSTDVIAFDHSEGEGGSRRLHGEVFVCVDEAIFNASQFRTTWQSEVLRYIVHGILHLRGHDDKRPAARRRMKIEENRLLRALTRRFTLSKLERRRGRA